MTEVTQESINRMEDRVTKGMDHLAEKMEKLSEALAELTHQHIELRTRLESTTETTWYKDRKVQAHGGIGATLITVASILTTVPDREEPVRQHITVEAAQDHTLHECDPLTEFCEE